MLHFPWSHTPRPQAFMQGLPLRKARQSLGRGQTVSVSWKQPDTGSQRSRVHRSPSSQSVAKPRQRPFTQRESRTQGPAKHGVSSAAFSSIQVPVPGSNSEERHASRLVHSGATLASPETSTDIAPIAHSALTAPVTEPAVRGNHATPIRLCPNPLRSSRVVATVKGGVASRVTLIGARPRFSTRISRSEAKPTNACRKSSFAGVSLTDPVAGTKRSRGPQLQPAASRI